MKGTNARKLTALLLAVSTALCLTGVSAFAADPGSTGGDTSTSSAAQWTVSKSKTATELANDGRTTVTLSLPSAEEELKSDVVFVIDASDCSAKVLPQVVSLISALKTSQEKTNAEIKIGIVIFKGSAVPVAKLEVLNDEFVQKWSTLLSGWVTSGNPEGASVEYLKTVSKDLVAHGTNLPSGLEAANDMLKSDTEVSANRKYLITVTDGLTYLFNNANGQTAGIYNNGYSESPAMYECLFYQWQILNNIGDEYKLPENFSWSSYYEAVAKNVKADAGAYDIACSSRSSTAPDWRFVETSNNDYSNFVVGKNVIRYLDEDGKVSADAGNHAYGMDRSIYESTELYRTMCAAGYQCFAINPSETEQQFGGLFTSELNKMAGKSGSLDFDSIKNDIVYLLGSGTVTDEIGDNFDLFMETGKCPFTLAMDGAALTAVQDPDNANIWYFGEKLSSGGYPYSVQYFPASGTGTEQFVWTISVPVENSHRIELSYQEQLVNKETKAGKYTVPTNGDTTLNYKDSNGTSKDPESFTSPEVSYIVSPTGGGGTSSSSSTSGGTSSSSPSSSDISDPSTPLAPQPSSAAASETPASSGSGTGAEIPDPQTPGSNGPETGDTADTAVSAVFAAISLAGLLIIFAGGRKHGRKV